MSEFKLNSIGTASSKLKRGDVWIDVFPHEILNDYKGDVSGYKNKKKVTISTLQESNKVIKTTKKMTLRAKWKGTGGNQLTPPTIHVGELVELWKAKDSDRWFWTKLRNEPDVRGLEDEVTMWSNLDRSKKKNIGKLAGMKDSYSHVVSTKKGYVQFTSSKANGEKVKITDRYDMKNGYVKLSDDKGNFVKLNCIKGIWGVKTNSAIKLIAPNVEITGNLSVKGKTTLTGSFDVNGNTSFNGNTDVKGILRSAVSYSCCTF